MKNGDIWEIFQKHVQCFGSDHIRMSKVKGHATEADVQEGRVADWDRDGNNQCDKYAGEAASLYGTGVPHLAKAYAYNHELYQIVTMHVHIFLCSMYSEYNALRIKRK